MTTNKYVLNNSVGKERRQKPKEQWLEAIKIYNKKRLHQHLQKLSPSIGAGHCQWSKKTPDSTNPKCNLPDKD